MSGPLRILLVEDSADDELLLLEHLEVVGYAPSCTRVQDAEAMKQALAAGDWDVVISDYNLPTFKAEEALDILHASGLDIPFVLVSGAIGEERAVAIMKAGAHDYVMKDNLARLAPAIEREIREVAVRAERYAAEEALRHMALTDALTDLPNRTLLNDRLEQALHQARRLGAPLALLIIDLDRFKEINDAFGHAYGDLVLQALSQRIRRALRASDTVARLGGDEFAVILPTCASSSDAERAATKLLRVIQEPLIVEGQSLYVGGSIGVVLYPDHGADPATLLRRADMAMYAAKRDGEGWRMYAQHQDAEANSIVALTAALRDGIDRGHLVAHYQPKVELLSRRVLGAEALVRWDHPERGLIAPERFIGTAERTGLIKPMTAWMLETALSQVSAWQRQDIDLKIAVNLSMRSLHDPQLPNLLIELMKATNTSERCLQLEITETVLMSNPGRALDVIHRLNGMGIEFAVDDFGTGYSSLAYLQRLPVRELKIDKSFVSGMGRKEGDRAIVQSIIDLAHNLGLRVVAEGVETAEVAGLLSELGCDAAQGYYFAHPMAPEHLPAWLDAEASTPRLVEL